MKDNEKKLSLIYKTLDDLDHKVFLENAKFAFEIIINAFNKNDKKTLKNLLTNNVLTSFEDAIDKVMMGVQRKSMILSEEEKKVTAYNEAGHALVAL